MPGLKKLMVAGAVALAVAAALLLRGDFTGSIEPGGTPDPTASEAAAPDSQSLDTLPPADPARPAGGRGSAEAVAAPGAQAEADAPDPPDWDPPLLAEGEVGVRVTDRDGRPLKGVLVLLREHADDYRQGAEAARGYSNAKGECVFVGIETDLVTLEADGSTIGREVVENELIVTGEWEELTLGVGTALDIRVTYADGRPAEGWEVVTFSRRRGPTDAAGRVSFPPLAPYGFEGVPDDELPEGLRAVDVAVWRPGDSHPAFVKEYPMPAVRRVSVEVELPAMTTLTIEAPGWDVPRAYGLWRERSEDSDGPGMGEPDDHSRDVRVEAGTTRTRVERLVAGDYHLKVEGEGCLRWRFEFQVVQGQENVFRLPPLGPPIELLLWDHNGKPVPKGADLMLEGPAPRHDCSSVSGWIQLTEEGRCVVRGMEPGTWTTKWGWHQRVSPGGYHGGGGEMTFTLGVGEKQKSLQYPKPPPPPEPNPYKR